MKNLIKSLLIIGILLSISSCRKTVFNWDLMIKNNTSYELDLFEKTSSGDYYYIGTIMPYGTLKERGYVLDVDYYFQAKESDTTFITFSHSENFSKKEQSHKEILWVIN